MVLNLESVGKIQGIHELGWGTITSLFLLFSTGNCFFSFKYKCDLVHLINSPYDLVISIRAVPDILKYTLLTTSKLWPFSDLSFNASITKTQAFIEHA